MEWVTSNSNNDQLARIPLGKVTELKVPVVPNGRDKILYIVEHNNNWNGGMHGDININNKKAERFRASYSNPFASHYNSKLYSRYIATVIPADWIKPTDNFVTV